jgi:hypothetical protein
VVNYWTDIVTRQLFSVHASSILDCALVRPVHSRALRRSRRCLWTFLSFPAPTALARSADQIVLEQRFYFGWRNLVSFRPRNWEILGIIRFSSANSTDFDHFWLNFAKSFDLKK